MAVSTGVQTLSAEAVETLSASKHEPTWMRDRRLAAVVRLLLTAFSLKRPHGV